MCRSSGARMSFYLHGRCDVCQRLGKLACVGAPLGVHGWCCDNDPPDSRMGTHSCPRTFATDHGLPHRTRLQSYPIRFSNEWPAEARRDALDRIWSTLPPYIRFENLIG